MSIIQTIQSSLEILHGWFYKSFMRTGIRVVLLLGLEPIEVSTVTK